MENTLDQLEAYYQILEAIQQVDDLGLKAIQVDAVDFYKKRIEEIEAQIRESVSEEV